MSPFPKHKPEWSWPETATAAYPLYFITFTSGGLILNYKANEHWAGDDWKETITWMDFDEKCRINLAKEHCPSVIIDEIYSTVHSFWNETDIHEFTWQWDDRDIPIMYGNWSYKLQFTKEEIELSIFLDKQCQKVCTLAYHLYENKLLNILSDNHMAPILQQQVVFLLEQKEMIKKHTK